LRRPIEIDEQHFQLHFRFHLYQQQDQWPAIIKKKAAARSSAAQVSFSVLGSQDEKACMLHDYSGNIKKKHALQLTNSPQ
jgi:hypothetical protein